MSASQELHRIQELFGGKRLLGRVVKTPLEAHELLVGGLGSKAVIHFVQKENTYLHRAHVLAVIGMSERTFQRYKAQKGIFVSSEQSGRAWRFAEVLAKAIAVFGSRAEAERWLEAPASGLDEQKPIELLKTPVGAGLVSDFLGRLQYGVYT